MPCSERAAARCDGRGACSIGALGARHRVDAWPGCGRALGPRRDPAARDIPVLRTRRLRHRSGSRSASTIGGRDRRPARPSARPSSPNARHARHSRAGSTICATTWPPRVGSPDAEPDRPCPGSRSSHAWRNLGCRQEVLVLSSGDEHRPGRPPCARDAELVPDLGEPLAFELYSYDVHGRRRRVDAWTRWHPATAVDGDGRGPLPARDLQGRRTGDRDQCRASTSSRLRPR